MRFLSVPLAAALLWPVFGPAAHAQDARPVHLEKLNTEGDETDPFVLSDGLSMLYATNKKGKFEIWLSKRATPTGAWGQGTFFFGEPDADVRSPFFFNQFLYFSTNAVPDEKLKDAKNFDIYRKVDKVRPSPVPQVNSPEDELHLYITAGGKEMYFSRKTKEGWKLMTTTGPTAAGIKEAKEVGFPAGFRSATLSPNGLSMFLEGEPEEGKTAIYRSKRDKVGGTWSAPALVKSLVHAEAKRGDSSPFLAAGGTRLYFASDRPGGKGGLDLWSVAVSELKE